MITAEEARAQTVHKTERPMSALTSLKVRLAIKRTVWSGYSRVRIQVPRCEFNDARRVLIDAGYRIDDWSIASPEDRGKGHTRWMDVVW